MRFVICVVPLLFLAACATSVSAPAPQLAPVPVQQTCKDALMQDIAQINADLTMLGYK